MTSITPTLMRAKQACDYLSIGKSLFYQLIADGYLPKGTAIRKHYVVWATSDLDAFAENHLRGGSDSECSIDIIKQDIHALLDSANNEGACK